MSISRDEKSLLESICISEDEYCDLKPAYLFLKTCKLYSAIIDINMLKETHGYIMDINEASEFACILRCAQVEGKIFWYCQPEEIQDSLNKLLMKQGRILPMDFVKEFLWIHPFSDGNGRLAKLLYCFLTGELRVWNNHSEFIKHLHEFNCENNYLQ